MKPKKHTNKQANNQLDLTVACVAGACQCDSQTNNFTLNVYQVVKYKERYTF